MDGSGKHRTATVSVFALLYLGCGGPLGPIPGGTLRGPEVACPAVFPSDVEETEIEVRPEAAYSVTTWNVVVDGALHIPADFLNPVKRWPYYLEADDRVRIRIGSLVYACRARRVEHPERIERLRAAAAAKYGLSADGAAASTEIWWFEIVGR
jgi:antitoxin component of MazEF toxin-antitoxin module